jgi:HEAT repeat protein
MAIRLKALWQLIALLAFASMTGGCSSFIPAHDTAHPTAPATLPEVLDALSSNSAGARITAAYALPRFGAEAVVAVPALIQNLYYETNSDVRIAVIFALGNLGADACSTVPALIRVLQNDDAVHARRSAAKALGQIGEPSSVSALANSLYDEDIGVTAGSAGSIASITGESFSDTGSLYGGYLLNEEGVPLIVIAAREWWEEKGRLQYQGDESD